MMNEYQLICEMNNSVMSCLFLSCLPDLFWFCVFAVLNSTRVPPTVNFST